MRKLCPNIDKEDGLETVLEVPIPEEMFSSMGSNPQLRLQNMLTWMRAQTSDKWSQPAIIGRINELRFLLYLVGSPLIPLQVQLGHSVHKPVKDSSIQASTAKYIVQQYIAAMGGPPALNAVHSMCVTGMVKITATEFHQSDQSKNVKSSDEAGGFVLWQKDPDLWCLELVVSGCKVVCGSNGNLSWRLSSNQLSPVTTGPPRPLRRFLQGLIRPIRLRGPSGSEAAHCMTGHGPLLYQAYRPAPQPIMRPVPRHRSEFVHTKGLDPRSTANLFLDATCIGEKIINNIDCFILKLETSPAIREAQSGPHYEIIHHTIWGYFCQRSGLMIQFEDSRLLSMKTKDDNEVFWETSMESVMEDYKYVDGVNIAHGGRTRVTVFRYGEQSANHKREIEERWKIEEVDFNVWGLSAVHFTPPTTDVKM